MDVLIMVAQLLLGLSILVGLHELGHLLAAKAFGMRVEKYSIGFPPKIWGFQYGETEYSIGAIPLGGFVKISGMIDESLDTKSMDAEPQPWEFRAKPAWQRLIVMMGGIIVNVITGIIVFIFLAAYIGDVYLTKEEINKHGLTFNELGKELGFQNGDRIVQINGEDYERFSDITNYDVILGENSFYTVDRGGEQLKIYLPNNFLDKYSDSDSKLFVQPRFPFEVGEITKDSPASKGGLMKDDKILSVSGQAITYYDEFAKVLGENIEKPIEVLVNRDGNEKTLSIVVDKDGKVGFQLIRLLNSSKRDYTFGESVSNGTVEAFEVIWVNIKALRKMFKGDVDPRKSLSGPIQIATIYGDEFDWLRFWRITGLLSMVLAFMNFLPIPALDGGHVMFLTYEMVSGRKPSDKFMENAQKVGMILLLGLMGFVIINDIFRVAG
ncbi:MAG: RIP metalloprotease RseP [bacterium]|nr:RIP metalloprotease RseP [bacterium]